MNRKKKLVSFVITFLLSAIAVSAIYPVYFLLINSLRDGAGGGGGYAFFAFNQFFIKNYQAIFSSYDIPRYFFNTMFVTVISIIFLLLFSSMSAFVLSKYKFRGHALISSGFLAALMIPWSILMVPLYLFMAQLKLTNNYLSLIIYYVASCLPYAIYLMERYMHGIPDELLESARIDGAGFGKIYTHIILALSKPVLATVLVLHFIYYFNEFQFSFLLLNKANLRTLNVAVVSMRGQFQTNMSLMMAGMMTNTIPIIIIFFLFQENLQKGLVSGSIK